MRNTMLMSKRIEQRIVYLRNQRVILDSDLAKLYHVATKVLVQAVKRNNERFPEDFMLRLTQEECDNLRSQFVTSSWGGRRYVPLAFTEQGIAMLSSVLRSRRAIKVNLEIMRTFVRLRRILEANQALQIKLEELEMTCNRKFKMVFDAIRDLVSLPEKKKNPIGFV